MDISATIAQDLCDSIGWELGSVVSIAGMSGAVVASTARERVGDAEQTLGGVTRTLEDLTTLSRTIANRAGSLGSGLVGGVTEVLRQARN